MQTLGGPRVLILGLAVITLSSYICTQLPKPGVLHRLQQWGKRDQCPLPWGHSSNNPPPPFSREGGQLSTPQRQDSKVQLLATQHAHTPVRTRGLCLQVLMLLPIHTSSDALHARAPTTQVRKLKTRGKEDSPSPGHMAGRQQSWEAPSPHALFLSHTRCPLTCTKCSTFSLSASPFPSLPHTPTPPSPCRCH